MHNMFVYIETDTYSDIRATCCENVNFTLHMLLLENAEICVVIWSEENSSTIFIPSISFHFCFLYTYSFKLLKKAQETDRNCLNKRMT